MRALNKTDKKPGDWIFGVFKNIIKIMIDFFFVILDEGTSSLWNEYFFTEPKENSTLIKHFCPMYIDFDGYPPYGGAISEIFETNFNANIQCGYVYYFYI